MSRTQRLSLLVGAVFAALGVALGAFGAHALRDTLGPQRLSWWHTGVQYQMWHAVALVALAAVPLPRAGPAVVLLSAGTVLFSGSLYAMALTDVRWLGAVAPVGGAGMIAGWVILAAKALRSTRLRQLRDD